MLYLRRTGSVGNFSTTQRPTRFAQWTLKASPAQLERMATSDELDAATAALVGRWFLTGQGTMQRGDKDTRRGLSL